jgi:hypothetical protein
MINKPLEEWTTGDWMEAKTSMNNNAFKQMVKIARVGKIQIPSVVVPNYNPRITFVSESDTAMYQRVKDVESVNKFNADVKAWTLKVENELKASAEAMFSHPEREVTTDFPRLADSIAAKVKFDKQYKLETRSVGFSIARHGVYLHQGARRGHGGFVGGKWTDKYGRQKQTSALSLGKQGLGESKAVHWFNPVIERNMDELIEIVANYSADIAININSILLPE